nr:hypothetical protein [Anaerolineae bacterium]
MSQNRGFIILVVVLVLAFTLLRTRESILPDSDVMALASQGKPAVIEVFSNT